MVKKDEPGGPGANDESRFIASMKRLREQKGWSQGEMARRMADSGWEGFHQTTISRIEKGERPVRLGEAKGIASALGVPVERMLVPSKEAELLQNLSESLIQAMDFGFRLSSGIDDYLNANRYIVRCLEQAEQGGMALSEDPAVREQWLELKARADHWLSFTIQDVIERHLAVIERHREEADAVDLDIS